MKEESFLEMLPWEASVTPLQLLSSLPWKHTPQIAKLTPPKYMKIQKKVHTTKTTQNALKYKAKIIYYYGTLNL